MERILYYGLFVDEESTNKLSKLDKNKLDIGKQKVKVDLQILGIALANHSLFILTKDGDFTKYIDFLKNERRYKTLMEKDESLANELLNNQIENAKKRYEYYKTLANQEKNDE